MAILKNISAFFKVIGSISSLNGYHKELDEARESGNKVLERKLIGEDLKLWTSTVVKEFDIKIEVEGRENIPEEDGFCVISNHQGYADIIAVIQALDGRQLGFIAKDSLAKVPYLGKWISRIRGLFIKRGNTREALESMKEGIALIKDGYNLAIFPEGTRSRGPEMGKFKPGSFKLATRAKAPILPVSLSGSYKCFEENSVVSYGETIKVKIHPAITTAGKDRKALLELDKEVPEIIKKGTEELAAE